MKGGATSERSEKTARIRREVDASLDRLAESLDTGTSDQMKVFLAAMGRFHSYSFQNLMLILSQYPEATRVAGFHTWRKFGRTVKKGEKGIAIFAPMRIKKKGEDQEDRPAKMPSSAKADDSDSTLLRFRVVHVFDVSQTEGEPLPEPARVSGDPSGVIDALKSVIAARGIELVEDADLGGADGVSTGGRIKIRGGLAPAAAFGVLAHELAHELLHQTEAKEDRPPKTVRETEAEAVAHVVCDAVGLDVGSASSDYIGLYQGDRETLAASLTRIQKTACGIIDGVREHLAETAEPKPEVCVAESVQSEAKVLSQAEPRLEPPAEPQTESLPDSQPEPEEFGGDIGEVTASYSADRIGLAGRVRRPFRWKEAEWVSVGQNRDDQNRVGQERLGQDRAVHEVYRLVDPEEFEGRLQTYEEKTADAAAARKDPHGFYHGMSIRYGQRPWVLCGPPVRLRAASQCQLSLFDRGRER